MLLSFRANWVYSEWGITTSTCAIKPFISGVPLAKLAMQKGEWKVARQGCPKSESSICLRYVFFGTIYDVGGWVITFGSITLALLWYDINSPTCWCSPKHGGVFFLFVPRCLLDAGARWPFIFDPSLRIHGKAGLIDDPLVGWVWDIPGGARLNCHVTGC